MKQNDKVVRKGDYFEIQVNQETIVKQDKIIKKQEFPSSLNIPLADHIVTSIPAAAEARASYFYVKTKNDISNSGFSDLQDQLRNMLEEDSSAEIKKQIEQMLKEIEIGKADSDISLNTLRAEENSKVQQKREKMQLKEIELTMNLDFDRIQKQLVQLQELNYPQISQLENLLEIMLGQRTINQNAINSVTTTLVNMDDKSKEEIDSVYTNLNSLTCLNNLYNLIEDLHKNDSKFVEMNEWVDKAAQITEINQDFSMELDADSNLLDELKKNFSENLENVRKIVKSFKEVKVK